MRNSAGEFSGWRCLACCLLVSYKPSESMCAYALDLRVAPTPLAAVAAAPLEKHAAVSRTRREPAPRGDRPFRSTVSSYGAGS